MFWSSQGRLFRFALEMFRHALLPQRMAIWMSCSGRGRRTHLVLGMHGNAARNGHLDILQWARAQDPSCPWDADICSCAALNGHLDILLWARAQDPTCPWDTRTCSFAARNGHLDILQWARAQDPPCPWNSETRITAASLGYVEDM